MVGHQQLPLQQRCISRTMGATWASPAGLRSLIVVVTIGALDEARRSVGREQAGNVGILPGARHRMKGLVCRIKFLARVRFGDGPVDLRFTARKAVRMAVETKFIFVRYRFYWRA